MTSPDPRPVAAARLRAAAALDPAGQAWLNDYAAWAQSATLEAGRAEAVAGALLGEEGKP